jgi:predicted Ser/Thr protein kinase
MQAGQAIELLKRDSFGRVERIVDSSGNAFVRRVACGGRIPFSAAVARILLERERRVLRALDGLPGVPRLVERDELRATLVREYVEGVPLPEARALPEDFFDELDRLVAALHARGVCHNDLHKEPNVIVGRDGFPWIVDFQLASVHASSTCAFETRAAEDLRHIEKHRGRYTRHGRGPRGERTFGSGAGRRRSWLALAWRRLGKPFYVALTRALPRMSDGESRRPRSGPWPTWTAPVGPRAPLTRSPLT